MLKIVFEYVWGLFTGDTPCEMVVTNALAPVKFEVSSTGKAGFAAFVIIGLALFAISIITRKRRSRC